VKRGGFLTAVIGGFALVLAVWVTSTDAIHLLRNDPPGRFKLPPGMRPHPVTNRHGKPTTPPVERHDLTPGYMKIIEDVVLGTVAAICLAFVVFGLVALSRRIQGRGRRAADFEEVSVVDVWLPPPAMVAAAQRQLVALREGDPRNAIVACWMDLEAACADSGFPRLPAETSTEFTGRVLAHFSVRHEVIESLAALYREARFSEHQLTEHHRERAVLGLRHVLDDLQSPHPERLTAAAAP
jgi:hypothetical protein